MRKIVKSSNVTIGDKKEIVKCHNIYTSNGLPKNSNQRDSLSGEKDYLMDDERSTNAEKEIAQKLIDADQQAKLIINEAYKDSKLIFENAKSEGYAKGYAEGFEAGKQETDCIMQEALSIKKNILNSKYSITKELEKDIVTLVLETAEKVVYSNLEESRESILGLIRLGLEKCTYTESLTLRISPMDYDYVISVKDRILCLAENIEDINIKKDTSLKRGSCILDTVSGSIDSSVEAQFVHIHETFKQLLGSE